MPRSVAAYGSVSACGTSWLTQRPAVAPRRADATPYQKAALMGRALLIDFLYFESEEHDGDGDGDGD